MITSDTFVSSDFALQILEVHMSQNVKRANHKPTHASQKTVHGVRASGKTSARDQEFPNGNGGSVGRIRFTPVSAIIVFKTTVIIAVLIVATVAMVYKITDAAVWAFLTMIAGYAALSNSSDKKKD
jgi:hypothetical protein